MSFQYEVCWRCKKRIIKSTKRHYCPYCGAKKRNTEEYHKSNFISLDLTPEQASFVGSRCFTDTIGDSGQEYYDIAKEINDQLTGQCPWIPEMEKIPSEVSD